MCNISCGMYGNIIMVLFYFVASSFYHVVRFKAWQTAKCFFGSGADELIAFRNCLHCNSKIACSAHVNSYKVKKFQQKYFFNFPNFQQNQFTLVEIGLIPVYYGYNSGWSNHAIQNLHTKNVYYQMSKKLIL